MALLSTYVCIFGSKHDSQKKAIEYSVPRACSVALLVMGLAMPPHALAFEAELPHANAKRLVALVQVVDESLEVKVAPKPDYSQRMSAVAMSYPTVETKSGDWKSKKLARASGAGVYYQPRAVPTSGEPLVLQGEASYYSRAGCLGCNPGRIMANGQPLNDSALTMAIGANLKHLVGRQAKVTNVVTGQSVEVLITDTGGFHQAKYGYRVADLTVATKQAIGMYGGVGQVRVEVY